MLYAVALHWCWKTSGDPYRAAIAHEAAKNAAKSINTGFATAVIEADDEDEDEYDLASAGLGKDKGQILSQKQASAVNETAIVEAMHAAERKIPNPFLPDFWAVLFLFVVIIGHGLVWFVQRWSLRVMALVQYAKTSALRPGCFAYITPHAHQGSAEIVAVQEKRVNGKTHYFIMFQRQKYEISEDGLRMSDLEMPIGHKMREYISHSGYKTNDSAEAAKEIYGSNSLQIELPSFTTTFQKQVLGPVPVFQFFCASLWLLDEYWNYALFNIFAICMYEASTAFGKLKNLQALRGMKNEAVKIYVYRQSRWVEVTTEDLLPGDIFSLAKSGTEEVAVPCDALILRGAAVVNEASLTGESTPQMKEAAVAEGIAGEEELDIEKKHRVHTLYSGTSMLQHTSPPAMQGAILAPDGGCVCYCLRTGFSSSQGKLVRMIEYSQEQV